jgi:hypothetical protein
VRLLRDSREPFVRSGWRDQKDRIELVLKQILSPRLCFLRNQICHEHSVDPGLSRCRGEWFRAELQERIEITEEDDGYIDVLPDVLAQVSASCTVTPFRSARSDAR